MTRFPNFVAVIQKDEIGDIIDIFENDESISSFKNDENYIITSIEDALSYKNEHPQKNFCIGSYLPKEIVDFLMAARRKLPKAPAHEIHWGIVTEDCKAKMIAWIKNSIKVYENSDISIEEVAKDIYEEVLSLGYSEGSEAAASNFDEEGW